MRVQLRTVMMGRTHRRFKAKLQPLQSLAKVPLIFMRTFRRCYRPWAPKKWNVYGRTLVRHPLLCPRGRNLKELVCRSRLRWCVHCHVCL